MPRRRDCLRMATVSTFARLDDWFSRRRDMVDQRGPIASGLATGQHVVVRVSIRGERADGDHRFPACDVLAQPRPGPPTERAGFFPADTGGRASDEPCLLPKIEGLVRPSESPGFVT